MNENNIDKLLNESGVKKALFKKLTFSLETPIFNFINGKKPYVFEDYWNE